MTKKDLEKEVIELRRDLSQMTSIVSEVFVQSKILNSKEPLNQHLLGIVNKVYSFNKKYKVNEK